MNFWQSGFWSAGFWSAGFWGDDDAVTPAPPDFGQGGGTGGGSWPRPWHAPARRPSDDGDALFLSGLI